MSLQTQQLVMVGLGSLSDDPPNELQPRLADGVHLRWGFERSQGFPPFGHQLFRRPHDKGDPVCIAAAIPPFPPGPLTSSLLSIPGHAQVRSDRTLIVTDDFAPLGSLELDLAKRSILRVFFLPGAPVRRVELRIGFRSAAKIEVTALFGATPVARAIVAGDAGAIETVELAFDSISSIAIGAGPAALVDLCYVPVSQNATVGWKPIEEYPYPLTLPVTHPDYPAQSAPTPKLDEMRALAKARVRYGDPARFVAPGAIVANGGTIAVIAGSPIVIGTHAGWDESVIGEVLRVDGDDDAYTVIALIDPNRLVLSRPYGGATASGRGYAIAQDNFAGLHDYLVHLVQGGATPPMADRLVPQPAYSAGTVTVTGGSASVVGSGTSWTTALAELSFQLVGDDSVYKVVGVPSATELTLDRGFQGGDAGSSAYAIEPLLVPAQPDAMPPRMAPQSPLDMVLLATLEPAFAQMIGLYWIDEKADPAERYDYLLVADREGRFHKMGPFKTVAEIAHNGFGGSQAYIVFDKRKDKSPPLEAPAGLKSYALPGGMVVDPSGALQDANGSAGLGWDYGQTSFGTLLPDRAIMYHLWRADAGDDEPPAPIAAGQHKLITVADGPTGEPVPRPVIIAEPPADPPQRPADWPPFALQALDQGRPEGWYSYRASGIDIFGRHTAKSAPAAWYQWAPPPAPPPWYYVQPPGDRSVHDFSIRLLDKVSPPPPVAFEAFALDQLDPLVVRDAAYQAWRAALPPAEQDVVVGLRARWMWTEAQMRQAPDLHEFRLYIQAGTEPPTPDAGVPVNWPQRVYVVPADAHVTTGTDSQGRPLRIYEILLPGPDDEDRDVVPLLPDRGQPLVFGHVAVSVADDKLHSPDDPKWDGTRWGGRTGNEGRTTAAAKIYRVLREPPPPPGIPPADSARVYATPADTHSRSYFGYRWLPLPQLKTHIWRALDDSIFKADWRRRESGPAPISATDESLFPNEWRGTDPSLAAKRAEIADALNAFDGCAHDEAGTAQAMAAYRALGNDALRVLAGLPASDIAFTQRTVLPLDPDDLQTVNRLAPNDPAGLAIDPALRLYVDSLDGRTTNRYFYRATYVDDAHNGSALSLAGPPVYCPNIVPPRAPILIGAQGGDRQVVLRWSANREADLTAYRVYRADAKEDARDLRLMELVTTIAVPAGDPAQRPAEASWTDADVPTGIPLYYRVAAIDEAGNLSAPSLPIAAQAFDDRRPAPPAWDAATTTVEGPQLRWTLANPAHLALVQRRDTTDYPPRWDNLSSWLAADTQSLVDRNRMTGHAYAYRIRVRDPQGVLNRDFHELEL